MITRAARTWLPSGIARDVTVEHEGARIVAVRESRAGDPPALDGLLVPGTVNAHLHLELSSLASQVPATQLGFPEWASRLRASPPADRAATFAAARAMSAAGVAVVGDVSTHADTADALTAAGLTGLIWKEFLGFDAARWPTAAGEAAAFHDRAGHFMRRACAHAIFSTPPDLLRAALARGSVPTTVHLGEDPAERQFLAGEGPWPEILDRLGLDWRWFAPPGGTPVDYLASLNLLRPDVLLVHAVHLTADDRAALAAADAPVVLCPRSNLHIGGRLPDVPALLAAGVRLALGTDSLASSPSLDPLDEIPFLAEAFPRVPPATWLHLATAAGADALRLPAHGRIAAGCTPGLVLLEGIVEPSDLARGAPPRRWLVPPAPAW